MNSPNGRWLRCPHPAPGMPTRLVCLPHAGGSASAYRSWGQLLGPETEVHTVQYPGREDRFGEPLVDDLTTVVERVVTEMEPLTGGRYALFGHSMGAAIAYEVAARLQRLGLPAPVHLVVSGRQPPVHHRGGSVHTRTDTELAAELVRLSPMNAELFAEPELAALVLPVVRNDYRLIECYRPGEPTVLTVPVTALIGTADHELTAAEARDWAGCTRGRFRLREYPGDHFFLVDQRRAVTDLLRHTLLPPTGPAPPPRDSDPKESPVTHPNPSPAVEFYDLVTRTHSEGGEALRSVLGEVDPGTGPVLDVGAGTGRTVRVIAEALPEVQILAVEPDLVMRTVLTHQVAASEDLRRRVTILAEPAQTMPLPQRLSAVVLFGVVGLLDHDERRRLWDRLLPRLAPGAPVVVELLPIDRPQQLPPMPYASDQIGEHRYEATLRGEPGAQDLMLLDTTWHVTGGPGPDRVVHGSSQWHTFGLADLARETGLAPTPLTRQTGVLRVAP